MTDLLDDVKLDPFSDPVDAIKYAQEAEKRAEARYVNIAEMTKDPGIRTLMLELAVEERGHFDKLQNILDTYFHMEF
jgi:rubrerythrin